MALPPWLLGHPGTDGRLGHHHGKVQRVVALGRGGAGKSTLARQLGEVTGLPVAELDTLFWQAGLTATDPSEWTECQRKLVRGEAWILDGDLGPYDSALDVRLWAAGTITVGLRSPSVLPDPRAGSEQTETGESDSYSRRFPAIIFP